MFATRSAVLSLAAGLLAIGGAQAADLPVKARAVEYVRVCSLYGAGFFYIPGTDTCIKIGGYFRADVTFNGGAHGQPAWSGDIGEHDRYFDYFSDRSRMALQIDTRTATEFGVVRTFGHANFQFTTLGNNTFSPNSLATNLGNNQNLLDTPGDGFVGIEYLFIQFAGFTFGKSASAYATPWQGFPSNITSFLMGGQNTDTGVPNIQYTADFGSGLSFTAGLEDPTVWDRTFLYNLSTGLNAVGTTGNAYAGVHAPDMNVRFRVDQAWGLFQISAAAHQVDGAYPERQQRDSQQSVGNFGPPRYQMGRLGDGGLVDQEHPDRRGRRLEDGRKLRQGRQQERDFDRRSLADLRDIRRQRPRLPEPWLRCHHRRGVAATAERRHRRHQADGVVWFPWRVYAQLECILVERLVRRRILCAV